MDDKNIADNAFGVFDNHLCITSGNTQMYDFIGENVFASMYHLLNEKDQRKIKESIDENTSVGTVCEELIQVSKNGELKRYIIKIDRNDKKELEVLITSLDEVDEDRLEAAALKELHTSFLTLSESIMFRYTPDDNRFRMFWQNFEQVVDVYDCDLDEWREQIFEEKRIQEEDRNVFNIFCETLKEAERRQSFTFHSDILTLTTHYENCHVSFCPRVVNGRKNILGIWSIFNDSTGANVENFVEGSYVDPLTQLLNKRAITDYAQKMVMEGRKMCLVVMDVDNFKGINDNYGHMFGDQVLKATADVLRRSIGKNGVAGRIGGDEFMVVIEKYEDELEMRSYLRMIKTNINAIMQDKLVTKLTCSMGISQNIVNSCDYKELFQIADKALYIAKQKGKNRYVIYKPELHGQLLTTDESADLENIKNTFYSEKDVFLTNKLLSDVVVQGKGALPQLLEQAAKTLMLDRMSIYWGDENELVAVNDLAVNSKKLFLNLADNEKYLDLFDHDMWQLNNINTIEYTHPEVFTMLQEMNIKSTMQHLLRDVNGKVYGIMLGDECKTIRNFPKIAVQIFETIAQIVNGVLIRSDNVSFSEKDLEILDEISLKLFNVLSDSSDTTFFFASNMKKNMSKWSAAAVKYFGFKSDILCPADIEWSKNIYPDDLPRYLENFSDMIAHVSSVHDIKYRMKNAKGEYVWINCKGNMKYDVNGEPEFFAGFVTIM